MPDDDAEPPLHDVRPEHQRTHELLELLLLEVQALRADLKMEPVVPFPVRHPAGADTELLAMLLPVIAAALGERVFVVSDLYAAAERNPELKRVLIDVGGANRTGRLLRAARGHVFAGYQVQAVGESGCGVVWRIDAAGRHTGR